MSPARPTIVPKPEEQEQPWQWSEAALARHRRARARRPDAAARRVAGRRALRRGDLLRLRPRDRRAARRRRIDRPPEPGPVRQPRRHPAHPGAAAEVRRSRRPSTCRPSSAMLHPDEQRRVVGRGPRDRHPRLDPRAQLDPARGSERDLQMRAADMLEKISGQRPVGIRTPSWDFSPHTLAITRDMGLLYDSSLMADDDCYELLLDGQPTGVVELPVEWIRDDAVYFNMNRFASLRPYTPPSAVLEIFRREFDAAYAEGGLFQLTMHPHIIGHRSRMMILEELIQHIRAHAGIWFATHADVARYVKRGLNDKQRRQGNETDNSGIAGRDRRGSVARRRGRGLGAGQIRPRQQQRLRQSRSARRSSTSAAPRRASTSTTGCYRWVDNPPKMIPWLAESYTASADGKTWTFKLQQGREVPRRQRVHRRRRALQHRAHAGDEEGRVVAVPAHHRPGQHQGARQVHGRVHAQGAVGDLPRHRAGNPDRQLQAGEEEREGRRLGPGVAGQERGQHRLLQAQALRSGDRLRRRTLQGAFRRLGRRRRSTRSSSAPCWRPTPACRG